MPPEIMKHKVDQTLIALRQADPQATVAAIVRTAEAAEDHRAEVEATGLAVQRVFRLVPLGSGGQRHRRVGSGRPALGKVDFTRSGSARDAWNVKREA